MLTHWVSSLAEHCMLLPHSLRAGEAASRIGQTGVIDILTGGGERQPPPEKDELPFAEDFTLVQITSKCEQCGRSTHYTTRAFDSPQTIRRVLRSVWHPRKL